LTDEIGRDFFQIGFLFEIGPEKHLPVIGD